MKDANRIQYVSATDAEALAGFETLARAEGIIPALESAHAIAHAIEAAHLMRKDEIIIVSLSGRGDKDVETVLKLKEEKRVDDNADGAINREGRL